MKSTETPPASRCPQRRPKLVAAAVATTATLVLVACGGTGGKVTPSSSGQVTTTMPSLAPSTETPSTEAPVPTTEAAAPTTEAPATASFGDTFTYADGLKATVNRPVIFTPSDTAAGATPGDTAIKFTVALTNGTGKTFDTSGAIVRVTLGSAGTQAGTIIDDGIQGSFSGSIVPGSSQTVTFGFDIPKGSGGKVDVEVQPGFDYNSEHWIGTVS
jgi:hypothetical protein